MTAAGLSFEQRDNCFTDVQDFTRARRCSTNNCGPVGVG